MEMRASQTHTRETPSVWSGRRLVVVLLAVMSAAIVVESLRLRGWPLLPFTKSCEMLNVALSLARDGAFANPFPVMATGPTAHVPPLLPAVMAGLLRLVGKENLIAALYFLRLITFALHCGLLVVLSIKILGDVRPGLAAAALSILLPLYAVQFTVYWEGLYAATAAMAWVVFSWHHIAYPSWRAFFVGLAAGLLLLLSPAMLAVEVPVILFQRVRIKPFLIIVTGILLVCLPWAIRNKLAVGSFCIRDNLGLELQFANSPASRPGMLASRLAAPSAEPAASLVEARRLSSMGEGAYYSTRGAMALQWIRTHPAEFMRLTASRIWRFLFPQQTGFRRYAYSVSLITVISFLGAGVLFRVNRTALLMLVVMIGIYSPVYVITHSNIRFRYPILWIFELMAGCVTLAIPRRGTATGLLPSSKWSRFGGFVSRWSGGSS